MNCNLDNLYNLYLGIDSLRFAYLEVVEVVEVVNSLVSPPPSDVTGDHS